MTAALLLALPVAFVLGWIVGRSFRADAEQFWRGRSDYWFTRAMQAEYPARFAPPAFHHHPQVRATGYATVDELMPRVVHLPEGG